jgi:hypothetical protein
MLNFYFYFSGLNYSLKWLIFQQRGDKVREERMRLEEESDRRKRDKGYRNMEPPVVGAGREAI